MKQPKENAPHRVSADSLRPLFIFLTIYLLLFFGLACRKYNVMNSNARDSAWVVNSFWYTLHGKLFYSPYNGMSYLGNHAAFIYLLFVPFYWLLPSAYTMLFLQSATITASGVPFFLIARRTLEENRSALLMTAAYLLHPLVVTNHVNQIHLEHFALPFLVGATYFYLKRQPWPFLVLALLAMLVEEHICLTVAMLGVYGITRRYGWRLVALPIVSAILYGWFVFSVAMPHFIGDHAYLPSHYFGYLGKTPGEVIKTCLTQPLNLISHIYDLDRGMYLLKILQPLLWITPLFAREFLLVLPALGVNLIVDDSSFRVIPWHYGPTVGAFLSISAVFGVRRLATILETRWQVIQGRFTLAVAICALSLASWPFWLNIAEFLQPPYYGTLQRTVELVPPEKSVVAPLSMVAHFANRQFPFHMLQFDPNEPVQDTWPREKLYTMDYVILDANERRFPQEIVTRDLFTSFYTNTSYELILSENNVFVFRHRESPQ